MVHISIYYPIIIIIYIYIYIYLFFSSHDPRYPFSILRCRPPEDPNRVAPRFANSASDATVECLFGALETRKKHGMCVEKWENHRKMEGYPQVNIEKTIEHGYL